MVRVRALECRGAQLAVARPLGQSSGIICNRRLSTKELDHDSHALHAGVGGIFPFCGIAARILGQRSTHFAARLSARGSTRAGRLTCARRTWTALHDSDCAHSLL
jgi:hypothetical protein